MEYWYCLNHQAVEGQDGCAYKDRLGPYQQEADAARASRRSRSATRSGTTTHAGTTRPRTEGGHPPGPRGVAVAVRRMMGMAGTFFLYAASGLLAPWYGVTLLLLVWVVLFVVACRWWTPHPKLMLVLPGIAVVIWFAVLILEAPRWTA